MMFANFAERVTLVVRGASLAASMSTYLILQLESKTNVTVELDAEVTACAGSQSLERLTLRDRRDGSMRLEETDGLFIFIGAVADSDWLSDAVQRDRLTGTAIDNGAWPLDRDPMLLETSAAGVFAAGDVRSGSIKRVASGVGGGMLAIHQ